MVSDDNLALLEGTGIKYISAMDKSQLKGITGLDFTEFSHLEPEQVDRQSEELAGFARLGGNTYYREVKVEGERRYILCFNPQLFKDQRKAREQAVDDFQLFVKELNEELRQAKKSRQRGPTYDKFKRRLEKKKLSGFVDVQLKVEHVRCKAADGPEREVRTYIGEVAVDGAQMLLAGRLDGFWLLVTNHKEREGEVFRLPAEEAIIPYRDKVVIESAFRDIKSFLEVAPVHVWTEYHIKAHYTVCVVAHLVDRTLTLRLHKHPGDLTRDVVSHEKLYQKLSGCLIDRIEVENIGLSTYNMTQITEEKKELLQRVGFENLLTRDVVKKAQYR
jgi:transposase